MVALDPVAVRNFTTSRQVFDGWFDGPENAREAWWVRLVAALWTESGGKILAHTGTWGGGGWINDAQKAVLKTSAQYPHDGFGSNGGSVGALQQIPTPVARLATDQFTGQSRAWDGWGTIPDCMALETSIPKFLARLKVTNNTNYGSKPMADPIVADLLRVQQPLESEVASNYGGSVVAAAHEIAGMFPRVVSPTEPDWIIDMADQAALDAYRAQIVNDLKDGGGHSGRDIAQRTDQLAAQLSQIEGQVADIQNRIIPAGGGWDNFQDVQNRLIPEVLAAVKALSDKVDALSTKLDK